MNQAEQGIAAYIGRERLAYLQSVTIGLAGAGGLGSNCAMHLVRCGFKRFVLVDHDRVEPSNLNRQAFTLDQVGQHKVEALAVNLRQVNPDLVIEQRTFRLTRDTIAAAFMDCDAVVEALDGPVYKKSVVEAMLPTGKLVVTASGIGGTGDSDAIITRKVRDELYMIGDMATECSEEHPPFSPKVGVAAAKQADAVFNYFLTRFEQKKEGK